MPRKTKDAPGRVTPKGGKKPGAAGARTTPPASTGRYTPPIPREFRESSRWVPILIIAFFGSGVLWILLNYLSVLGTPSNWYLLGGLGLIVCGFIASTRWH
jgi:Cell division protein CrgA